MEDKQLNVRVTVGGRIQILGPGEWLSTNSRKQSIFLFVMVIP